ncbi:MAG: ABC transporter substrate-binding protein [Proteobacteria bacterium]|nr:ABC transporter substrate-binding protein [Pseudomonadota bacterium]
MQKSTLRSFTAPGQGGCTAIATALLLVGLLLTLLSACGESGPIIIGFAGPLEGTYSDLGVQGRNGAQLAIELENTRGGVNGRALKLISEHDGETPDQARVAVKILKDSGAIAIIGHMLSAQSLASYELAEELKIPRVSPTSATPLLSNREDLFFRLIPSGTELAQGLASYCRTEDRAETVFTLLDLDNKAFTAPFTQAFGERFSSLGGRILEQSGIHSSTTQSWEDIARRIETSGASALFVALSARDLAALASQLRVQGCMIPIYSTMWAYTRELILAGGRAVEGIIFAVSYIGDSQRPEFLEFQRRYQERFGWLPNYAAAFGYEAANVLIEALRWTGGDPSKLPAGMLAFGNHPGVTGPILFNPYGDVIRPSYLVTIREREFLTLATIGSD